MITAAAVLALAVYLVERLRPVLVRWLFTEAKPLPSIPDLPHPLRMLVLAENAGWAREQVEERFRELYADLGSWEAVSDFVHAGSGAGNGSASRR